MPNPTCRFAIGSPTDRRSPVWRLHVHKNEVYLSMRDSMRIMKLSMHSSGQWNLAHYDPRQRDSDNRVINNRLKQWRRPPERIPGWTIGPILVCPWFPWAGELGRVSPIPAAIEWLPGPTENQASWTSLLFGTEQDPGRLLDTLGEPGGCYITDPLPLLSGERVWVFHILRNLTPDESFTLNNELPTPMDGFTISNAEAGGVEAWMIKYSTTTEGAPLLIHHEVGERHLALQGR